MSYGKEDLYDIIDTILFDELKPCERETHYNRLVTALDRHFNPQQMRQTTDNINDFYHELRQLAPTCNFVNVDAEIKSQITVGCNANRIQEKGLYQPQHNPTGTITAHQNIAASELPSSMND